MPKLSKLDVKEVMGYPPRLSIAVQTAPDFMSPEIQVDGLDRECGYNLLPIFCKINSIMHGSSKSCPIYFLH